MDENRVRAHHSLFFGRLGDCPAQGDKETRICPPDEHPQGFVRTLFQQRPRRRGAVRLRGGSPNRQVEKESTLNGRDNRARREKCRDKRENPGAVTNVRGPTPAQPPAVCVNSVLL